MPRTASSGMQSTLDPAGAAAELIDRLAMVLFAGGGLIFVLVAALALYGALSGAKPISAGKWVIGGGLLIPLVVLTALFLYAIAVGDAVSNLGSASATRIHVVGKRWWWEVRYTHPDGGRETVLANELRIPVGEPVEILLSSDDLIHSFWVPALGGKVDMIPGRVNRIVLHATRAGVFRGQCAEYCGAQHARMAFYVIAEPQTEYRAWLAREAMPAVEPADPFLRAGREAFLRGGCDACHTIRGTAASGRLGPDLTHFGSRRSLAAGTLDNGAGNIAGWIADSQKVKPGNLMPEATVFDGRELRAVAAYLESLK